MKRIWLALILIPVPIYSEAACPPPKALIELAHAEKISRFERSRDPCERFSLAFDLHFDGAGFQQSWGRKAMTELERINDYRSLTTYSLQLFSLLDPADPGRADFQFFALRGVHGALSSIDPQHDQTWLQWALHLDFGAHDGRAEALAYGSFLDRYPADPRFKLVEAWRDEAALLYLNLERSIAKGLVSRKQYFAPVVRWESDTNQRELQGSKYFSDFVAETILAREVLLAKIESTPESQIRMWFRLEPRAPYRVEEVKRAVRRVNCDDLAKLRKQWPEKTLGAELQRLRSLCQGNK